MFIGIRIGIPEMGGGDPSLTLRQNFLLTTASTIDQAKITGPTLTFTRASNGKVWNESGVLQYAPNNELENSKLGTRTGDLPSGWVWQVETGSVVWTDPGSYSQGVFSVSSTRQTLQNAVTVVASTTYTAFAYITESAITAENEVILITVGSNGTDGDITHSDWVSLGGVAGWYAVGFTMGADTDVTLRIGAGGTAPATGTVTISRPGIVKGLLPGVGVNVPAKLSGEPLGRWIGTDDGDEPLYDHPRFDHDPANGNAALGLLVEEQRTNLTLQSEQITATGWTNGGCVLTADSTVAPDGNTTADTIEDDSAVAFREVHTTSGYVVSDNQSYTFSVYILKDAIAPTTRFPAIRLEYSGGTSTGTDFFLDTQSGATNSNKFSGAGTVGDVGAVDFGDYWRFFGTFTNDATGNTVLGFTIFPAIGANADLQTETAAAIGSIIVWGMQVELGAFLTSYIPTTSATVTRAKDVCSTTDVSWHNVAAQTWYVSASRPFINTTSAKIFEIASNAQGSNEPKVDFRASGSGSNWEVNVSQQDTTNPSMNSAAEEVANTVHQMAVAFDVNTESLVFDGDVDDETFDQPYQTDIGYDTFSIGFRIGELDYWNGYIQAIKFWNVRKPNAFLVSETA
jgi:hypothetical protein